MSQTRATQTLDRKRVGPNKLVLGFLVTAVTAIAGTASVAGAAPDGKPTKDECLQNGYTNYGQCVKDWAHDKGDGGYGGGNTNVNTNVNVDVNGNNNAVTVIIRYLFG